MEYETGIFKRYIRKRNGKEVTQVGVSGLSVNSKFEDDEEIIILSKDELTQLENQITDLKNQLNEAKTETVETPKYSNKVIELQELINNRNQLLFNTQTSINRIINEVTSQYYELDKEVTTANNSTKTNIISLLTELQDITNTVLELSTELENQVKGINSQVDNIGLLKWIRSKNKFKIVLDTDKIKRLEVQLNEFNNTDTVEKANEVLTPVEIPTDNLDKLTAPDLDLTELYISTGNDNTENTITIPPEAVNNGNDN